MGEIQPLGITGQGLATALHQPFGLPFELSGKTCAPGGAGQGHQMVRIPLLQRHQQMTQQATVDALVRAQVQAGEALAQPRIELGLLQAAAGQLLQLLQPLSLLGQQGLRLQGLALLQEVQPAALPLLKQPLSMVVSAHCP